MWRYELFPRTILFFNATKAQVDLVDACLDCEGLHIGELGISGSDRGLVAMSVCVGETKDRPLSTFECCKRVQGGGDSVDCSICVS